MGTAQLTLLRDALPELVKEVSGLLIDGGGPELVEQTPSLRIMGRCRCGDDFCATIYTAPHSVGQWGRIEETISLDPDEGMMILEVAKGWITEIEILY